MRCGFLCWHSHGAAEPHPQEAWAEALPRTMRAAGSLDSGCGPSHHAATPYLVSRVRGPGLGHQQPHHGVPLLSRPAVPCGHCEGHLLRGDAQLPGGVDCPVCPDFEVQAVGLILQPLAPQTAAELNWKRRGRRSGWPGGPGWQQSQCILGLQRASGRSSLSSPPHCEGCLLHRCPEGPPGAHHRPNAAASPRQMWLPMLPWHLPQSVSARWAPPTQRHFLVTLLPHANSHCLSKP